VFRNCFTGGLLARSTANVLAFSPPLIITRPEIDALFEMLAAAIRATP
jgi:beta-alanine--pyruvate transaminase